MLIELKSATLNRMDIDDLLELSAYARALENEAKELGVELPEWIAENAQSIRREIKAKNRDRLAARIKAVKARRETLKTPDEKRTALDNELAVLEAELAKA